MATCFRIALTPGEPAGIGPDLAVTLAQQVQLHEIVAIADPELLQERARLLGLPLKIRIANFADSPKPSVAGELTVLPVALGAEVNAGELNIRNAGYILQTLDAAIAGCIAGDFAALVVTPIINSSTNLAPRSITSIWPSVIGSNVPGYTPILCAIRGLSP